MDISYEQKLSFDFLTTQKIIKKIGEIDSFSGKWELVEQKNNRYLKELRRIATIESIGVSGGGKAHNNMPPFITVNFIICVQGLYPPRQ